MTAFFLPSHQEGSSALFPIGPYWSLFFELIANFIYAAIRRFLSDSILLAIIVSFGIMLFYVSYQHGNLDIGSNWGYQSFIAGFVRSIFSIFLGLFLFRHEKYFEKYTKNKSYLAWLAVLGAILILSSPNAGGFNWIIDGLTVSFIFPFFVLCSSQGIPTKLQGTLLTLGSASYPIYLLHVPASQIFAFTFKSYVNALAPISGILLTFSLILISLWVEKNFDIPLRRWMSNKLFPKV